MRAAGGAGGAGWAAGREMSCVRQKVYPPTTSVIPLRAGRRRACFKKGYLIWLTYFPGSSINTLIHYHTRKVAELKVETRIEIDNETNMNVEYWTKLSNKSATGIGMRSSIEVTIKSGLEPRMNSDSTKIKTLEKYQSIESRMRRHRSLSTRKLAQLRGILRYAVETLHETTEISFRLLKDLEERRKAPSP
ncbi:hypothetical protein EVAR_19522_1 [Eumeta japonica]|uniref:Uncharacterized protein n=1 Tax=Eumeta variegata TaxID=151549 RepID=A0A4C1UGD2_EUMVA|nr:hypothetical protein EVAR_19522_1 [Eumeta japonica]